MSLTSETPGSGTTYHDSLRSATDTASLKTRVTTRLRRKTSSAEEESRGRLFEHSVEAIRETSMLLNSFKIESFVPHGSGSDEPAAGNKDVFKFVRISDTHYFVDEVKFGNDDRLASFFLVFWPAGNQIKHRG
ncbi:hypothetical protein CSOJ01_04527 [Colletotrichum sojae]|uniref:Uncharacterized protein n=1 Tax=Colletotrichum sojae TaxID=2175907 RepID=A0A8H6JIV1_9PEZI|nr:hypothetical protein CSOJ01_04527 [Colletotrichum sojae]